MSGKQAHITRGWHLGGSLGDLDGWPKKHEIGKSAVQL
jgi:hypothetical protein